MHNDLEKFLEGVYAVVGMVVFVIGIYCLQQLFQAGTIVFAALWIAIPLFAWSLIRPSMGELFTLRGLRWLRTVLLIAVAVISVFMVFNGENIRNRIGKHFVAGYVHWQAESVYDPYCGYYYPGDRWATENRSGWWGLFLLQWGIIGAGCGLPYATWKACSRAIGRKQREIDENEHHKLYEAACRDGFFRGSYSEWCKQEERENAYINDHIEDYLDGGCLLYEAACRRGFRGPYSEWCESHPKELERYLREHR